MKQLGDILLEGGLLSPDQLDTAVEEQRRLGRSLGRVLVDLGAVTEGQLVSALAQQIGVHLVDLSGDAVDAHAVATVPAALCHRYTVLPIGFEDGRLVVAMADASDRAAVDDLRYRTGLEVKPVAASRPDVVAALARHHPLDAEDPTVADAPGPLPTDAAAEAEAPSAAVVERLVAQAVHFRAAALHLEPVGRGLRVRARIDGVLRDVETAAGTRAEGVTDRVKTLAGLDVAEHRVAQDGALQVTVEGARVDLRVSVLPTASGEKLVLHVVDRPAERSLRDLGLPEQGAADLAHSLARPRGLVLVTGPPGSGRSTTLGACLDAVHREDVSVVTVGDMGERRLPGVAHVAATGTTAAALGPVLRADPDVVLVDVLSDGETARLAVEAALAGRLVVTTLDAADAASAVVRLMALGVEPLLAGAALTCVLSQRLVRRLCASCAEPSLPSASVVAANDLPWPPGEPLAGVSRPVGCGACSGTGFRGRLALYEVLALGEDVARLVGEGPSAAELRSRAREQGTTGLREDGLRRVLAGETSLDEVLRVVGERAAD